jgi:hypothetical protein
MPGVGKIRTGRVLFSLLKIFYSFSICLLVVYNHQKYVVKLVMMSLVCDPNYLGGRAGRITVLGKSRLKKLAKPNLKKISCGGTH